MVTTLDLKTDNPKREREQRSDAACRECGRVAALQDPIGFTEKLVFALTSRRPAFCHFCRTWFYASRFNRKTFEPQEVDESPLARPAPLFLEVDEGFPFDQLREKHRKAEQDLGIADSEEAAQAWQASRWPEPRRERPKFRLV